MTEFIEELKFVFLGDDRYMLLIEGFFNTLKITAGALLIGVIIGIIVAAIRSSYDKNNVILSFVLPAGNDFTINPVSFCNKLFEIIGEADVTNHKITRHMIMTKDEKEFK